MIDQRFKLLAGKARHFFRVYTNSIRLLAVGKHSNLGRLAREYYFIRHSGLFDSGFYSAQQPSLGGLDPPMHYLLLGAAQDLNPSPLFDSRWYSQQNPDVAQTGANLFAHFLRRGWREGRNPHPVFDVAFYLEQHPELMKGGINPLIHYLSGRDANSSSPHVLFDHERYLLQNPDVAAAGQNALVHYLLSGWREGREPHILFQTAYYLENVPAERNLKINPLVDFLATGFQERLSPIPLFDFSYYAELYPDVAQTGINLFIHFLRSGWQENRNPHPLFNTAFYLEQTPGLAQQRVNPLTHYLSARGLEAHNPHALFDSRRYLTKYPDVVASDQNALVHYLLFGWKEGRDPHALFQTVYYLEHNPTLGESGINPLVDFVTNGFHPNRHPHALFDCEYYLQLYKDVAVTGGNALVHYVTSGSDEMRIPHALFDPTYYNRQVEDADGRAGLAHYLQKGVHLGLSPHPLFDANFYLKELPPSSVVRQNPVGHYLQEGSWQGLDPCELFDTSFYLERYSEVRLSGSNPLVHYITKGAKTGFDPNPLFDSTYYLEQNPDVVASGQNPLVHYMYVGGFEGRAPSSFFDSAFYLRNNPRVRQSRINPLTHYLARGGAEEGRNPSPFLSASDYIKKHPEVKTLALNPLLHFLGFYEQPHPPAAEDTARPTSTTKTVFSPRILKITEDSKQSKDRLPVICVSHVSPDSPRAGNEYRINRLLHWMKDRGHDVIPVISPLPHDNVSDLQVQSLANQFGSALICQRNGQLVCCLGRDDTETVISLDGKSASNYTDHLGPRSQAGTKAVDLLEIDRTFCPDALIDVVSELVSYRQGCIVLAEYVFMSRLLPLLPDKALKVIDTHDVFSSKSKKVLAYGISDSLSLTEDEERDRLSRADLVLAIQPEERNQLEKIIDHRSKVITVGVDFSPSYIDAPSAGRKIIYIASNNSMNVRGLRDFLRFVWPFILEALPDAELFVAGHICSSVKFEHSHVTLLGLVDDLARVYQMARVAINPALAGTGLKIKTLESLSFFRPLVTWPTGVDGLHPKLAALCEVASDWFQFQQKLIRILVTDRETWFTEKDKATIREQLSPAAAYRSLAEELAARSHSAETISV